MESEIPKELLRRIELLEDPANQGAEFNASTWFWMLALGIALPAALIVWAWV